MIYQAIKVKEQLKRVEQLQKRPKFESSKNDKPVTNSPFGNTKTSTCKTCDTKYFKCQGQHIASKCVNKREMVINSQGDLESKDKEEVDDEMLPLVNADDEKNTIDVDLLETRRVLNMQVKKEENT